MVRASCEYGMAVNVNLTTPQACLDRGDGDVGRRGGGTLSAYKLKAYGSPEDEQRF
jgi:hypothetical protein